METIKLKKSAYVEVVEQPAGKGLRFRYECEGRSAGSIPGSHSTQENRTFPTIRVVGYKGRAVVVVSCVSAEVPYRPHPHNLVGKEGCKKGVCTLELGEDMTCSFPSLGIQCVKKKDIEDSLNLRQQIRVDPFQTGFTHKTNPAAVDLNCVRLAFQVFLEGNDAGAFTFALKPVVSDPIYDKKSKCDLTICRLTETSASVAGGKEILLFCDKVTKDDIQVRFYEESSNDSFTWEGFGDFQPADVHKQYGICFKTPKYHNIEIETPVKVLLQLRRPSDGAVSEPRSFEFLPLDAGRSYWSAKRLKTNYTVFNQILNVDQAIQAEELRHKSPTQRVEFPVSPGLAHLGLNLQYPGISETSPRPFDADDIKVEPITTGYRQHLNPVAMPGSGIHRLSQPGLMSVSSSLNSPSSSLVSPTTTSNRDSAPEVPVRSPLKSHLLHQPQIPSVPSRQPRPMSDLSLLSDFTQCDNASIVTRQSVNEILSLAEGSIASGDNINLDNMSIDFYFQEQGFIKLEEPSPVKVAPALRKISVDYMGSMSSVATVRENKAQSVQPIEEPSSSNIVEDIDMNQIYDDVMQCVYDDVDVKYDDLPMMDVNDPPVPPVRKRGLSVDRGVQNIDKPLPTAPKPPSIITILSEKKNELLKEREREQERKKQIEEQKRKEKEILDEQRRREKEEKELKRNEERERKRIEEEERKQKKKKEEEEKRLKSPESESEKLNQSLFQRLFQRTQSKLEDEEKSNDLDLPPPVPAHASNSNLEPSDPSKSQEPSERKQENGVPSPLIFDSDLSDIENFISQTGDLQRLDSMVNEFTNQFPTENNSSEDIKLVVPSF